MKKLQSIFLFIVVLSSTFTQAQKITFKLLNGSTLQPIEGASLKSYLHPTAQVLSDKYGHVTLILTENDTLSITKDYFHPLYIFVRIKNFDTTHVISINLVPSKEIHESVKSDFTSLTDFEYHFIHDQLGHDSHLNIKGYEHPSASQLRAEMMHTNKNPDGFHITPVLHPQQVGVTKYSIK